MTNVLYKSEDRIQQECYIWFWNTYPELRKLLFAVPNGGARNAREGKKFKDTGVVAGVSDLIFLHQGTAYLIEMKTPTGTQSKDQIDWEGRVKKQGFDYFIARSLEDFKEIITRIVE